MISDKFWNNFNQPLPGKTIILEPLQPQHYDELVLIADNPAIWTYLLAAEFKKWFEEAVMEKQQQIRCPYVVRQVDSGRVVGCTSYYEFSEKHRRCNIGYTWYHTSVWGTQVNPDCKLTLLRHGFEEMKFNRIAFKTDMRNTRSQRAIEKLGATREGVFRKHMILHDGNTRDTVYFSIVDDEWPKVREGLEKRVGT